MTRFLAFFTFLLFYFSGARAQSGGWNWGNGTTGNSTTSWAITASPSGGVYAAGVMANGAITFDNYNFPFVCRGSLCVISNYDYEGNFQWARSTPNGANTYLIGIAADNSGNCYMLGWMEDRTLDIGGQLLQNNAYPAKQYFLAKFDIYGNVLWAKNGGGRTGAPTMPVIPLGSGSSAKMLGLGGLTIGGDNSVYITTCFNQPKITIGADTLVNTDTTGATDDILVAKYDSSGNLLWATKAGGAGDDINTGIAVSPQQQLYVAGIFSSDIMRLGYLSVYDTIAPRWNAFLGRYDTGGRAQWVFGSGGSGNIYAAGVAADQYGNAYVTGGCTENMTFGGSTIVNPHPGKPYMYVQKFYPTNAGWNKIISANSGTPAYGYGVTSSIFYIWVTGAFVDSVNINGTNLDTPAASGAPIFVACYDTAGALLGAGALQSGSTHQVGIAASGSVAYVCADYTYPSSPFTVGNSVLPDVPTNEQWQYVAQFSLSGGGGPGGGTYIQHFYDTLRMCPLDSIVYVISQYYSHDQWNNGSTDSVAVFKAEGTYSFKAKGLYSAILIDSITVYTDASLCYCQPFLANAFTPNNDGTNDFYGPLFAKDCYVSSFEFFIFDRFGEIVFHSTNPGVQWDGTYKGMDAQVGVYMYYLKYGTNSPHPEHECKGDVTLIR